MTIEIGLDPVLLQVGPLQLGWHGIFSALGVLAAIWLTVRLQRRQPGWTGADDRRAQRVLLIAAGGGLAGARLFYVLDHLPAFAVNPLAVFAVWQGGIAVYGGFVGAVIAGVWAAQRAGLEPWRLLDAAAPGMLLGQAIGRVGCLWNGDAWGGPCDGTACLCVSYTHPAALLPRALQGVPTHPYPLYELVCDLMLMASVLSLGRRLLPGGVPFAIAVMGYGAIRFGLTFLRQEQAVFAGLQQAQVVALVTGVAAACIWWQRRSAPAPAALHERRL